ncbi:hypothetical protein FALCPG4_011547 [Fusarium falciforme]
MMRYGYPLPNYAYHASDLIPLFANSFDEAVRLLSKSLSDWLANLYAQPLINTNLAAACQTYFASFAASGDPNGLSLPLFAGQQPPKWPIADGSGDELANVLTVQIPSGQKAFVLASDDQNGKERCSFWTTLAGEIVEAQESNQDDAGNYGEL